MSIRLVRGRAAAVCVLAAACASARPAAPADRDLAALRTDLAELRHAQSALRERLDRLDSRLALLLASSPPRPAGAGERAEAAPALPPEATPDLPVVKLRAPRPPEAPALDTRIEVKEPTQEDLAALESGAPPAPQTRAALPADPDTLFADALARYNSGERASARESFLDFARTYPAHAAAGNALYLAGMASMAEGRCADALPRFEAVMRGYPSGDAAAPSMLAAARCEAAAGHAESARALFKRVVTEHPRTAEASQAEAEISSPVAARKDEG